MKRIVAVVVTYNRCELLKECIEALRSIEEKIDIMVVDNASTDNTSINAFRKPFVTPSPKLFVL